MGTTGGRSEMGTVDSKSSSEAGELIRSVVGYAIGTFEVDASADAFAGEEVCYHPKHSIS